MTAAIDRTRRRCATRTDLCHMQRQWEGSGHGERSCCFHLCHPSHESCLESSEQLTAEEVRNGGHENEMRRRDEHAVEVAGVGVQVQQHKLGLHRSGRAHHSGVGKPGDIVDRNEVDLAQSLRAVDLLVERERLAVTRNQVQARSQLDRMRWQQRSVLLRHRPHLIEQRARQGILGLRWQRLVDEGGEIPFERVGLHFEAKSPGRQRTLAVAVHQQNTTTSSGKCPTESQRTARLAYTKSRHKDRQNKSRQNKSSGM